jgi:hypothetical protein
MPASVVAENLAMYLMTTGRLRLRHLPAPCYGVDHQKTDKEFE